jgi:putative phage-type endonuclease
MATEIIVPSNQEHWLAMRKLDVTSTESAALFGMSPYVTHYDLWHRKKTGLVPEFVVNERMKWGNRLEAAIAHGIAEEQGWEIRPMKEYFRDPDMRMGSSFDFVITNLGEPVHLEIKNVDYLAFRDGWIEHEDGSIEAPEHIEMQVQHQMAVSGFKRAFIGAFIAGNRGVVIERLRDDDVIAAIRAKVADFWRTVDAGLEPEPVMPGDAEVIIRMNQYAKPGKILSAEGDDTLAEMLERYKKAAAAEKNAKEDKEVAKAEIFQHIGDAEKVLTNAWSVTCSMRADTPPTLITEDMVGKSYGGKSGFRNCLIYPRKPTK